MSESAGKTRRAAEVAANVAGATERRRVQSIREPLSPGAYVEYSVDDQPGVVERKPAPDTVLAAMRELGGTPERSVYVGDSEVDIQTAKNGGLTSCGVLWGFRSRQELEAEGADYLVENPEELIQVVLGRG